MTSSADSSPATDPTAEQTADPGALSGRSFERRHVLGAAAVVAGGLTLAACGSGSSSDAASSADAKASSEASAVESASGSVITDAASVPVGSAVLVTSGADPVLVSQPQSGSFKAFSAICTHQGCALKSVDGTKALCPCHGSAFNVDTGAVEQGPATQPLAEIGVKLDGANVVAT